MSLDLSKLSDKPHFLLLFALFPFLNLPYSVPFSYSPHNISIDRNYGHQWYPIRNTGQFLYHLLKECTTFFIASYRCHICKAFEKTMLMLVRLHFKPLMREAGTCLAKTITSSATSGDLFIVLQHLQSNTGLNYALLKLEKLNGKW